ncbi:trans-aconitate 2-methyltransferase [Rhodococcus sp. NCIMB 12038]|uniref:class I SAM-dependent methyltransferase n=1 Tax=Rhodococcus sp. NCIMB 12038 TaxID=933800 RepID=UPI000B3C6939|nr:class I SAM-dependent methyltransferase [Rhodococcus sp. NCIMB 12038]OUS92329.1 SAM-dependent methyltransferase [Rhodococcus sp. NCIMB 12038]
MVDWDGEGYADVGALQRAVAEQSIAGLDLAGTERVLDVGCGDGFVTLRIAERLPGGSVVGVDASPRMIAKAVSRAVPDGARAEFRIADARDLPFDGEFDVAVSFNALHWVPDLQVALAAIARSVVDGGRVIVQMVCAGRRTSVEDVMMAISARPQWAEFFTDFTAPYVHVDPATFRGLAKTAGLDTTDLVVRDVEWDFGSREEFVRWCTVGSTDWTAHLDAAAVPEFMDDVAREYEQTSGRPGLFLFTQMRAELVRTS